MANSDVTQAIRGVVVAMATANSWVYTLPNMPNPPQTVAHIRAEYLVGQSEQVSIGTDGAHRWRSVGTLFLGVFVPAEEGESALEPMVDEVISQFRGLATTPELTFLAPSPGKGFRDGPWFNRTVVCPFFYDEVA